jgi:hypothetical protein
VEFEIFNSFFPFRIPQSAFRISIARPVQEMRRALSFFAPPRQWRNFRAGQRLLGEKEEKLAGSGLLNKKIG